MFVGAYSSERTSTLQGVTSLLVRLEQGDQVSPKVEGHDLVGRPMKPAANEHCWRRDVAPKLHEGLLHFLPLGVLIKLIEEGCNSKLLEQNRDGVG